VEGEPELWILDLWICMGTMQGKDIIGCEFKVDGAGQHIEGESKRNVTVGFGFYMVDSFVDALDQISEFESGGIWSILV